MASTWTWPPGLVTPDMMNTYIENRLRALEALQQVNRPLCTAYLSASKSATVAAWWTIPFDTAEEDLTGMFSASQNGAVAAVPGWYQFNMFANVHAINCRFLQRFAVNNTQLSGRGGNSVVSGSTPRTEASLTRMAHLSTGDYVTAQIFADGGSLSGTVQVESTSAPNADGPQCRLEVYCVQPD